MRLASWLTLKLVAIHAAIQPPPWADPDINPCSTQPGGWLKLYWPEDGKCYRIFQMGGPCPATMELSPGPSRAECRCPPGHVQVDEKSPCHKIFTRGPCSKGQFLGPLQEDSRGRWGECYEVEECPREEDIFWPENKQCYQQFTRGPCPHGQLLIRQNRTSLPECGCAETGPFNKYYWKPTRTCHQFYTRGPCLDKGALFLPGPQCGCHSGLTNFHNATGQCYELGTSGPCKSGQIFTPSGCACKPDHIQWPDGHCYRAFTKGPCREGQFLSENGTCQSLPCPRGKLYFPADDTCHRVGVQGPCPRGQLVLFEQSVRPAVEGISYRGMCGCPGNGRCDQERSTKKSTESPKVTRHIDHSSASVCEDIEGQEICHKLYTQGPCGQGEWLVPSRGGRFRRKAEKPTIPRSIGVYIGHRFKANAESQQPIERVPQLFQDGEEKPKWRCECRPGYTPFKNGHGCQVPLIALAKFLNGEDYFTKQTDS